MSYEKSFLTELAKDSSDGYGRPKRLKSDYYFKENDSQVSKPWRPRVNHPQVKELIGAFKKQSTMIAGGAILGCLEALEFGDIDVFPLDATALENCDSILEELGYKMESQLPYSRMYLHQQSAYRHVQVLTIHTDVKDGWQLLRRFDLSCAQVGVLNGNLLSFTHSLQDIRKRTLRVCGTLSIKSLLDRLEKYQKRGFKFYDDDNSETKKVLKKNNG